MSSFVHHLFQTPFGISALLYFVALVAALLASATGRRALDRAQLATFAAAVLVNLGAIGQRWIAFGQPPFRSLFESMTLLGACLGLLGIAFAVLCRSRALTMGMSAAALSALAFALTRFDATPSLLPPALRSVWFIPHVVLYFFGYAFLALSALIAILHLWRTRAGRQEPLPLRRDLWTLADQTLRLGFVLMSFALVIGSVWARSAWGDYWTWDPKENWALATWLFYAAYLCLSRRAAWRHSRAAAFFPPIGLALILFTYLGMGLLPTADESAHVYLQTETSQTR